MNKEDINELKEIVQDAKRLEVLIGELEGPLTEKQKESLNQEFFCMGAVSIRPIGDVVSRIDSALHHPEEYPEPEPEQPFNGDADAVHKALCEIKDEWNTLFQNSRVNRLQAYLRFVQWVNLIYDYTEYLGKKYNLDVSAIKIGSIKMRSLGSCSVDGRISFNRRLIKDPGHAMTTAIHELCHLEYLNHSKYFWQLYEDICINEGVLLERVLGSKKSFRDIKESIPYRWDTSIDFFSDRESQAIEKYMKRSRYLRKNYTPDK